MSDTNFLEKEINKKNKKNLAKPILIGLSLISISFFLLFCLTGNKNNLKPLKILSETQEKIPRRKALDQFQPL